MKNALLRTHTWIVTRTGGPQAADRGADGGIPGLVYLVGGIAIAVAIVAIMTAVGEDLGNGIREAVR